MKILITNDDGIWAEGINTLASMLADEGFEVVVVAPDRPKSASSHAITLDTILPLKEVKMPCGMRGYAIVNGSPSDCVLIGLGDIAPDVSLVISGINHGANVGLDILYSGTVAAAVEGYIHGKPAIAVSVDSFEGEFADTAAQMVIRLLKAGIVGVLREISGVLNVNVPAIPVEDVKGFMVTRMGGQAFEDWVEKRIAPRGRIYYWLDGRRVDRWDEGTDGWAIKNGYVSLTPLSLDMTSVEDLDKVKRFISEFLDKEQGN